MEKSSRKIISKTLKGCLCELCSRKFTCIEALIIHYHSAYAFDVYFDKNPWVIYLFITRIKDRSKKTFAVIEYNSQLNRLIASIKNLWIKSINFSTDLRTKIDKRCGENYSQKSRSKNMSNRIFFHSVTGDPFDPNHTQVDSEEEISDE